ncbi:hypothetical protein KCU92_g314, partial [Aureobasidium melanogenum]
LPTTTLPPSGGWPSGPGFDSFSIVHWWLSPQAISGWSSLFSASEPRAAKSTAAYRRSNPRSEDGKVVDVGDSDYTNDAACRSK